MEPAAAPPAPVRRVGPAGWSYADWRGRVYPPRPGRDFDPLVWLARFFDTVEINASFYRIPDPRQAEGWTRRIAGHPAFRFAVKAPGRFTHGERRLEASDLAAFADFLAPLEEAGRLGPVLVQFPWSFRDTPASRDHLARLAEALAPRVVVVELRHGGWGDRDGRVDLGDLPLQVVGVDQPPVGRSLPPVPQGGPRLAYVRLHGRNRRTWFDPEAGRDARYDYTYRVEELRPWAASLAAPGAPGEAYVITNNHFQGQAVVNALQVRALLGQPVPAFPRWLEEEFPEIRRALAAAGAPGARPVGLDPQGDDPEGDGASGAPEQGSLF